MKYIDMEQHISLAGFDSLQEELLTALEQFQLIENNPNKSYIMWQNRTENLPLSNLIPGIRQWIIDEFKREMFAHVEKITFIVFDTNNTSWDKLDMMDEFVYVRPNLDTPTYISDTLLESRAAMWDLKDAVRDSRTTGYAVLFEGIFTDHFRNKLANV